MFAADLRRLLSSPRGLIVLAAGAVLIIGSPLVAQWADQASAGPSKYGLVPLLLVFPLTALVCAFLIARSFGRAAWFAVADLTLFALVAILVFYNSTALIYLLGPLLAGAAGAGAGLLLPKRARDAEYR